jgi:hypothetical protein
MIKQQPLQLRLVVMTLTLGILACGLPTIGPQATPPPAVPEPTPRLEADPTAINEQTDIADAGTADAEPTSITESPLADVADTINLSAYTIGEVPTANRSEHLLLSWRGSDETGALVEQVLDLTSLYQNEPQRAEYSMITFTRSNSDPGSAETAVIGEHYYWYEQEGGCFVIPIADVDETFADSLSPDVPLLGDAFLVEQDVDLGGRMADRFSLTEDNLAEVAAEDALGATQMELNEGSVYIAHDGDYITRVELKGTMPATSELTEDFGGESEVHYIIDVVAHEEPLQIEAPAGCAGNALDDFDYPLMADAIGLLSVPGGIFYESGSPVAEVVDFYRTEMAGQGWELVEENVVGNLYELFFEKDGLRVRITAAQNGDLVPVNIEEVE